MNVSVATLKGATYRRADNDFYPEPRWAVDALLDVEPVSSGTVLDPCCGSGTIVSACLDRGLHAIGSDIVNNGYRDVVIQDFFDRTEPVDTIICNPPYTHAQRFIEHGLRLAPKVIMLLRLVFVEAQCRQQFFETTPPARILVHARRPSLPAGIRTGVLDHNGAVIQPESRGGSVVYAWFVFERGYTGDTVLRRLESSPQPESWRCRCPLR